MISALLLANSLSAQFSIGHRVGFALADLTANGPEAYKESFNKNRSSVMGLVTAIQSEIAIGEHFALQPEIEFVQRGSRTTFGAGTTTSRLMYIGFDLLAKGIIGSGNTRLNVFAGPAFHRGVLATNYSSGYPTQFYGNGYYVNEFGPGQTDLRMLDISAIGGLAFDQRVGKCRLFMDLRYAYGLSGIYNEDLTITDNNGQTIGTSNIFNRTFMVQFGYLVPLSNDGANVPTQAP
jgi:Outer membrane protein beta-barrel domain